MSCVEIMKTRREQAVTTSVASAFPTYVAKPKGSVITDADRNEYIDFAGGVGVMNLGHRSQKVVEAITEQAKQFHHTAFFIAPYEGYAKVAEQLCAMAPGDTPNGPCL